MKPKGDSYLIFMAWQSLTLQRKEEAAKLETKESKVLGTFQKGTKVVQSRRKGLELGVKISHFCPNSVTSSDHATMNERFHFLATVCPP